MLDYFSAFNTVRRATILEEVAIRSPAPTSFDATVNGEHSADKRGFEMNTGKRSNIPSNIGSYQSDTLGPTIFCMPRGIILRRLRTHFELGARRSSDILNDITISFDNNIDWRQCRR